MGLLKSSVQVFGAVVVFLALIFALSFGIKYLDNDKSFEDKIVVLGQADRGWRIRDLNGHEHRLGDFYGKVVFINFWATWCYPCTQEMPSLQRLYNKLDNEVVFIFASDEDPATLVDFLKDNKYTLPVYLYTNVPQVFNYEGIPATFIVDTHGNVVFKEVGSNDWGAQKNIDFVRYIKRQ